MSSKKGVDFFKNVKYVLVHVELANIITEVLWVLGHS